MVTPEPESAMSGEIAQSVLLLLIPAACAILGLLLGRLILGRPGEIECERPRIATSTAYLLMHAVKHYRHIPEPDARSRLSIFAVSNLPKRKVTASMALSIRAPT
jgi:hypothetical protein